MNSGDSCSVVYLDLAKAFDKVPHKELLFKLWTTGITGNLWKWFRNYLSDRSHFVQFNSSCSEALYLSYQEYPKAVSSVLDNVYINDMPSAITSSSIYQ